MSTWARKRQSEWAERDYLSFGTVLRRASYFCNLDSMVAEAAAALAHFVYVPSCATFTRFPNFGFNCACVCVCFEQASRYAHSSRISDLSPESESESERSWYLSSLEIQQRDLCLEITRYLHKHKRGVVCCTLIVNIWLSARNFIWSRLERPIVNCSKKQVAKTTNDRNSPFQEAS